MIDFRQDEHVRTRLGWFHKRAFHAVMFDLSASAQRDIAVGWSRPLP